jgi:hypothetical protein
MERLPMTSQRTYRQDITPIKSTYLGTRKEPGGAQREGEGVQRTGVRRLPPRTKRAR